MLGSRCSYSITGGTGGLGLLFAAWMSQGGARDIVLLGRSGRGANPAEIQHLLQGGSQARLRTPVVYTNGYHAKAASHCVIHLVEVAVSANSACHSVRST